MPFVTFVTFWIFWDTFHFVDRNWTIYRYYIIQKDIYMYTYVSICIYIKQMNTVCHIWFMCNTFSGCLNLSSTLLCLGDSSCWILLELLAMDCSLIMTKGSCYQHISHLLSKPHRHWIYRTQPLTHTHMHRYTQMFKNTILWLPHSPSECSFPTSFSSSYTHTHPHTHQCHYYFTFVWSCPASHPIISFVKGFF